MLISDEGNITSPNFPDNYPDNARCAWDVGMENPKGRFNVNLIQLQVRFGLSIREGRDKKVYVTNFTVGRRSRRPHHF